MAALWLTHNPGQRIDVLAGMTAELVRSQRGEGRLVFVAVEQGLGLGLGLGQILGYGRARLWLPEEVAGHHGCPAGWWLSGSLVRVEHRRRGIGRALMQHRLQTLTAAAPGAAVHSRVDVDNRASLAMHAACGFVELTRDFSVPGQQDPNTPMTLQRWMPPRQRP